MPKCLQMSQIFQAPSDGKFFLFVCMYDIHMKKRKIKQNRNQ